MAFHHFYSRVPARMSIYNKTDGFDTFLHSAELSDEFIHGELAPIYANKLSCVDPTRVRHGDIPTVYFQCPASGGRVIQSALSYISRDYTGERSSYMVHSLVLDAADKERVFKGNGFSTLNPDMFHTDISRFNLNSPSTVPSRNCVPVDYVPKSMEGIKNGIYKYNPEMINAFIYAVFMCGCGMGKNICFRLPVDDTKLSRAALDFINLIMMILPYSFREKLSFATYVTDLSQHKDFSIRCLSSTCRLDAYMNCVFFDFGTGAMNVPMQNVKVYKPFTNFFYYLFERVDIRDKFHKYLDKVTEIYGADILDLGVLRDLILVFWQCSGFYKDVLRNDENVYEFFTIFEKYKEALDAEYRAKAYACLDRYPTAHRPIPANVFEKLKSIYPTEKTAARHTALAALLKLIHTDAMRAPLFDFIKKNYADELPETKKEINRDLCSVFYGGFLQNEILDFFDANLSHEPAETQTLIVEKMLLAIRTAAVQRQIVLILNKNYDALPQNLRNKIYENFFPNLVECDALSALLVDLVNANVNKESANIRDWVERNIFAYVNHAYSVNNQKLLPILVAKDGFCEDAVIRAIFTRQGTERLYADYVRLLASPLKNGKATKLIHIFKVVPDMSEEAYEKLILDCRAAFGNSVWATMYDLIRADKSASVGLPPKSLALFREQIIYPTVINTLYDVFKVRLGKDGIAVLEGYAKGNAVVTESERYKTVMEYVGMVEAAVAEDTESVFRHLIKLPTDAETRRDISDHIRMCSLNKNEQSEKTAILFELCINVLRDSTFRFDAIYTQYKNASIQRKRSEFGKTAKPERIMMEAIIDAIELILNIATEICNAHPDYIDLVCAENSGLERAISNFILSIGFGGAKFVRMQLADSPDALRDLAYYAIKDCKRDMPSFRERVKQMLRS